MYVEIEMTQNANVRDVIGRLADAVLEAAGPAFTGKVTLVVNVHQGRVKVAASTEEVVVTR